MITCISSFPILGFLTIFVFIIVSNSVLHVVMSVCMFGAVQFLNVFILTLLCFQFINFSNGN